MQFTHYESLVMVRITYISMLFGWVYC